MRKISSDVDRFLTDAYKETVYRTIKQNTKVSSHVFQSMFFRTLKSVMSEFCFSKKKIVDWLKCTALCTERKQ
jgi:nicotinic acid phosphoribosyltransferase